MAIIFTPPSRVNVPVVSPTTPKYQQRPFAYFKASIPRGTNVWIYTNNTISETQPPVWVATDTQPGVKKVFYGGRSYEITQNEKQILTQAGYGDNIVG
jgi:hypothetical protein